jgi:hypothetical protein
VASPRRAGHAASTSSRAGIDMEVGPSTTDSAEVAAAGAWSLRVRRVGGLIQTAFAGFWLVRGSVVLGGAVSDVLVAVFGVAVIVAFGYAVRVTAGMAPRRRSPEGKRIERAVTVATMIELVAAFVLPVIVSAAGHSDWVLPSIAITIGPLLLYLDHLVQIPRYRPVGWALTVGPVILVAILSGTALIATTGITAGLLLLGTAVAGFHDLAGVRRESERARAAALAVSTSAQAPL